MAQGRKTQRQRSVFSYSGGSDCAAGSRGSPEAIPRQAALLAGHGLTLTSALGWADEKGGWQQQGDARLGRVEGERDVLSPLPLLCFLPESILCARMGSACPWGCGSSA